MVHKWARWLHNPCRLGVPTASHRGAKSEVAHKWASRVHNPRRLGGPHRFKSGGRFRGGPQVGEVATKPLPPGGSPLFHIEGQKHRWPTSGQGGYITPAARGVPTASKRGAESEEAHKWARWVHNPCRLGFPHRFRSGGRIRGGPQVGKVATVPLLPRVSPPLQSGGQNHRWPTSGQGGYITPAAWGVPTASHGGAESEVADKWAGWLHNPCCLGGPHRFRAGSAIRGGPQEGKVAT